MKSLLKDVTNAAKLEDQNFKILDILELMKAEWDSHVVPPDQV